MSVRGCDFLVRRQFVETEENCQSKNGGTRQADIFTTGVRGNVRKGALGRRERVGLAEEFGKLIHDILVEPYVGPGKWGVGSVLMMWWGMDEDGSLG